MAPTEPNHGWALADVWDDHADRFPAEIALVDDRVRLPWYAFRSRAHAIAAGLAGLGVGSGAHVGVALHNRSEYLEIVYALSVARMVHVNTNYRYSTAELTSLWTDMHDDTVFFDATMTDRIDAVRALLPAIRWVAVDDPSPPWATSYDELLQADEDWQPPSRRSGNDLLIICTGGTTGQPKGVMWRQDDAFRALRVRAFGPHVAELPDSFDRHFLHDVVTRPGPVGLPAAPLMHATGLLNAISWLMAAGTAVTVPGRFDPIRLLDAIERERVEVLALVGDAFALPIAATLDAEPTRWNIDSLSRVVSSGVAWSADVKARLIAHNPGLTLVDGLGASEAVGMAAITTTAADDGGTTFTPSQHAVIVDDAGRIDTSSDAVGRIGVAGHVPLGYLDDPQRSAEVFPTINGRRYSVPGDFVERQPDGRLRLLGRGSGCINTGGEKVYPDEVEAVIRAHPQVVDVAVIGHPDPRWGQRVIAVVEPVADGLEPVAVTEWSKQLLAGYKVPRTVILVDSLRRGPNGKLDYAALRKTTAERLGP